MGKDIPPEVQAQISAFNAEQAAKKLLQSDNGETKKQRQLRESIRSGRVFTPRELV